MRRKVSVLQLLWREEEMSAECKNAGICVGTGHALAAEDLG